MLKGKKKHERKNERWALLSRFKKLSVVRQKICKAYDKIFFESSSDVVNFKRNYDQEVPHIYCVFIKNLKKREKLRKALLKAGIQTGIHYIPGKKIIINFL